jgi:hypothetical protein
MMFVYVCRILEKSKPAVGEAGRLETVEEVRLEMVIFSHTHWNDIEERNVI